MANLSNINNKFLVTTGGNVGINSTGPNEKLEVGGSIRIDNGASFTSYQVYRDNIKYGDVGGGGNQFTIQASNNKNINLFDDSGVGLTVKDGGNVGIGRTNPSKKLEIIGNGADDAVEIMLGTNTSSYRVTSIGQNDGNGVFEFGSYLDTYIVNRWTTNDNGDLILGTNNQEQMRISHSGNVGIGTEGPQALLDVEKNNSVIYNPADDLGQRSGTATIHITNQTATINTFGQLMYDSRTSGQGIARIVFLDSGSASVDMAFVTEHSDVKSEKMRIASDGNVGIGINNPDYPIDVNGIIRSKPRTQAANVSGKLILASDLNSVTQIGGVIGTISFTSDDSDAGADFEVGKIEVVNQNPYGLRNDMTFTTRDQNTVSEKMRIQWDGNVGIGTTSPFTNLEVAGSGLDSIIRLYAAGGTANIRTWEIRAVGVAGEGLLFRQVNDANNSYTNRMIIDTDGNVGIGTITPGSKLVVSGGTDTTYNDGTLKVVGSIALNSANNLNPSLNRWALRPRAGGVEGSFDIYDARNSSSRLTIVNSGYVGIGTTAPSELLEVMKDGGAIIRMHDPGNNSWKLKADTDFHIYDDSFSDYLTIKNSGNVGIGTTSPSEKLTIPGNYGVGLGYKTFYSSGGTVPAGIGPSYYLVATLNQLQGTTLTSKHQYKFFLTTTGTGTYNSSVYIVYANSNNTAWVVREVSRRGTTSNHPELTVSGTEARIYNDHPSSYGVLYRVETTNSNQANTAPEIFGSDYMWQRTAGRLSYIDGEVVISGASYSDGANNISLQQGLVKIGSATTTGTVSMYFTNPNGVVGSVVTDGSNTQFNTSSDYRLKEDLQDFNGLDKVSKIPVYNFKWKVDESRSYGVIAHELQEVLPDAVSGEKDAEEMQGVDYSKIVPLLIKSIQELKAEIELLKSK
jgi:hypothetical protein